jgi:hypothetical protein
MLNMCIKVTPAPASDYMVIQVARPGADKLFNPNIDWRLTAKQAEFTTPRGSVALTADPAAWGRVYSRGIFVAVDEAIRALRVALNVRTQLTRDRHVLPDKPTPLQSLAEILAEVVRAADSSACTALFMHLLDRFMHDRQNPHIVAAATEHALKPVMESYHAKQLSTTVERIVYAAEVCDERTAFVLKQLNLFVANNTGALEDKINLDARILELLAVCPDYIPSTAEAPYLAALKQYVAALSLNTKQYKWRTQVNFILSAKATQLTQYCVVEFGSNTVYLTGDLLQGDNWRVAAISVLNALSAALSGFYFEKDMLVPLAVDQLRFIADPLNFEPRKLQLGALSSQTSTPTSQQQQQQQQQQQPEPKQKQKPTLDPHELQRPAVERARVGYDSMQLLSLSPNSMVKSCSFKGVPQAFPAKVAVENHTALNRCAGGLVPAALVQQSTHSGIPIYVDAALMSDPAFVERMQAVPDVDSRLLYASQLLRVMRRNIVQELKLGETSSSTAVSDDTVVPIIIVICNDLLGFTYQGAVYVNVAPVLWHTKGVKALCESLFHTILHELAHRTIVEHDTLFADELARLVFRCSRCLDSDCFHSEQTAAQMTALCYELAPLHS